MVFLQAAIAISALYFTAASLTLCPTESGLFQDAAQSYWIAVEFHSPLQCIITALVLPSDDDLADGPAMIVQTEG